MDESTKMRKYVQKFQCPGCVVSAGVDCTEYNYDSKEQRCMSHGLGTMAGPGNLFALGMPKGFRIPGWREDRKARKTMDIRLWRKGKRPGWDRLNIAVWAMEHEGYLFVRTFAPRVNQTWVDVIEGGEIHFCPYAFNVAEFIDEID